MIRRTFVAILSLLMLVEAIGQTQEPPTQFPFDGIDLMQGLCEYNGLTPITLNEVESVGYDDTIFIILGDPGDATKLPAKVREGLAQGAAVLIAIETRIDLSGYFPDRAPVFVTGEKYQTLNPADCCLGRETLPYIRPRKATSIDSILDDLGIVKNNNQEPAEYELFRGFNKVATHRPSGLIRTRPSRYLSSAVAEFPPQTYSQSTLEQTIPESIKLGMAGSGPRGNPFRVLVLADRSIFTNQMLALSAAYNDSKSQPNSKTDNLAFSNNLIKWLIGPSQRKHCVFIDRGRPLGTFTKTFTTAEMPGMVPPIPSPLDPRIQQRMTEVVNNAVEKFENRDIPNQLIQGQNQSTSRYKRVLGGLATFVCVILALFLIRRLFNMGYKPNMSRRPKSTTPPLQGDHPPALKQTHQEVIRHGDYTDYVREYLQLLFTRQGLPAMFNPTAGSRPPKVDIDSAHAKAIRSAIATLWGIAYSPPTRPITFPRWKALQPDIDLLTRTAERDEWRFTEPGETR